MPPKSKKLENKIEEWRAPQGPVAEEDMSFGQKLRTKIRGGIEQVQDEYTSNPEDTVVGPALATALENIKESFPDPQTDTKMMQAAAPGPKLPPGVVNPRALAPVREKLAQEEISEINRQFRKLQKSFGDKVADVPADKPLLRQRLMQEAEYDPISGMVKNPDALKLKQATLEYEKIRGNPAPEITSKYK